MADERVAKRQSQGLKRLRAITGLTQQQVADNLGWPVDTYRGYEKGHAELRYGQFEPFAEAIGVSVAKFSAELGVGPDAAGVYTAECARIMGELKDEPPEVAETLLSWFRDSVRVMRRTAAARRN